MDADINDTINTNYTEGGRHEVNSLIANEILFAIICVVGLIGNTLVIYVIIRFSKMQTVTNMYIVNLAIADECFLIGIPFLMVTLYNERWIFGAVMCKTYMTLTSINQFTSSTFLCIMSADRYIAVCHPISSPKFRTPFISRVISFFAWTWSIMLMIPMVLYTKEVQLPNGDYSCTIFHSDNATDATEKTIKAFTLYNFACGFAIPLCLILTFYYLVIQKLKTVGPQNKSKEKKRSHRKVTNLVLTVITVYILCWTPYWVIQLTMLYTEPDQSTFLVIIHLVTSCLTYSNSAVNPILYAFLSDNFKKSFLKACTCAAGKDVNATLHMENSVFPRKNKQGSARFRSNRGTSIIPNNEEDYEIGPLVSKFDPSTSAITMTSRISSDVSPAVRENTLKNGISTLQPTNL